LSDTTDYINNTRVGQLVNDHDGLTPPLCDTPARSTQWCRILAMLIIVTVLLYGHRITYSMGDFSDASHHIANGIFLVDALQAHTESLADPMAYAEKYYSHFPAVNLGYYPPVFHVFEAVVMMVCGLSSVSAQITVLLFAVLLTYFTFSWMLIRFSMWWATAGTLLVISTPFLVYWGQDIMLEIPVLAFVVGAMWLFESLLQSKKPRWTTCLWWAALTSLAIWTKQHALVLLPIYAFSTLASRQWRKLLHPAIWVSILIIVLTSVSQVVVMLEFVGGDAVGHSIGFTRQHVLDRFNIAQWTFYFNRATQITSWPVIIFTILGILVVLIRRRRQDYPLLAWLVAFYLMHSYMKAQDVRYACMIIPPLCMLATLGIRYALVFTDGLPMGPIRKIATYAAMIILVGYQLYDASLVRVPHQATVCRQVANDLSAHMGPFACLSFAPQEPSRMATLYRLSIEHNRHETPNIFDHGSIYRADQLLSGWKSRWKNAAALAASLKKWNVKYILVEWPTPMIEQRGDMEAKEAIDAVIAIQEFKEVRQYAVNLTDPRYPVRILRFEVPRRTLHLYERIEPMTFNPGSVPPLHPKRVNFTINGRAKLSY